MEVTLLLCDFAEAVNGKLYVMGGGWNILFAPGQPVTMSVAAVIAVPWDRTNQQHELSLACSRTTAPPSRSRGRRSR